MTDIKLSDLTTLPPSTAHKHAVKKAFLKLQEELVDLLQVMYAEKKAQSSGYSRAWMQVARMV